MKIICTLTKSFFNSIIFLSYRFHPHPSRVGSLKMRRLTPPHCPTLLLAEGLAVRALIHGGILLMGADQDLVQRTVVLAGAVVCALLDSTLNALISMIGHGNSPPFLVLSTVCPDVRISCKGNFMCASILISHVFLRINYSQ